MSMNNNLKIRVSKLISEHQIYKSILVQGIENTRLQYGGRCTGRTSAIALQIISEAMLEGVCEIPQCKNGEEREHLRRTVCHLLSSLKYEGFSFTSKYTLKYNIMTVYTYDSED